MDALLEFNLITSAGFADLQPQHVDDESCHCRDGGTRAIDRILCQSRNEPSRSRPVSDGALRSRHFDLEKLTSQ